MNHFQPVLMALCHHSLSRFRPSALRSSAVALFVSGAVVLSGCAASGSQYYSLQAVPQAILASAAPQIFSDAINLQGVTVPAQVDRPQLVLSGKEGTQVSVMNEALWVAPLDDEIRLAVSTRLGQQLGVPDLNGSAIPEGLPLWSIRLSIQRFEAVYQKKVVVQASWRLSRQPAGSHNALPMICSATAELGAVGGVDDVVKAYRSALGLIADQIADQIKAARQGQDPGRVAVSNKGSVPGLSLQGCTAGKN